MKAVTIAAFICTSILLASCCPVNNQRRNAEKKLTSRASQLKNYALKKGFSTQYCFLIDMGMHSGLKRFFVYDTRNNKVVLSGLVAHGSCDQNYLKEVRFSNLPGGGCTSTGIYKVGYPYQGHYGKAYKLYGLENSNSNAFSRAVVLHSYSCVPDEEIYPKPVCNSFGCPMVSPGFLEKLNVFIRQSDKPVLLWIFN